MARFAASHAPADPNSLCSSTFTTRRPVDKRKLKLMTKSTCKSLPASTLECWRVAHRWCSRPIYERRMGQEIEGDVLGDEFKGYIFKLSGGNDKDGFPMKQGIMINGRTRMMFKTGRMYSFSLCLFNNDNPKSTFQVLPHTSPEGLASASADRCAAASTDPTWPLSSLPSSRRASRRSTR